MEPTSITTADRRICKDRLLQIESLCQCDRDQRWTKKPEGGYNADREARKVFNCDDRSHNDDYSQLVTDIERMQGGEPPRKGFLAWLDILKTKCEEIHQAKN